MHKLSRVLDPFMVDRGNTARIILEFHKKITREDRKESKCQKLKPCVLVPGLETKIYADNTASKSH